MLSSVKLEKATVNSHDCLFEILIHLTLRSIEILSDNILSREIFLNSAMLFFSFFYFLRLLFRTEGTKL